VWRYIHIKASYRSEDGAYIEKELSDLAARIWQHEIDHLNGLLYNDDMACKCVEKINFASLEEVHKFYEAKRKEKT